MGLIWLNFPNSSGEMLTGSVEHAVGEGRDALLEVGVATAALHLERRDQTALPHILPARCHKIKSN